MTARLDDSARLKAARRADTDSPGAPHRRRGAPESRSDAFLQGSSTDPGTGRVLTPLCEPSLHAVDALDAESLALCMTTDVRPLAGLTGYVDWRLCGQLSALVRAGVITGAHGEHVLVPNHGPLVPRRIFVFGWGPQASLEDGAPARFERMARVLADAGCESVAVGLPEPGARLVHLVEDHVRKALGARCVAVFGPDPLLRGAQRTSPASMPQP